MPSKLYPLVRQGRLSTSPAGGTDRIRTYVHRVAVCCLASWLQYHLVVLLGLEPEITALKGLCPDLLDDRTVYEAIKMRFLATSYSQD